jgi:formamidopyrimidine-DNA glycosylase
MPELPEVETIVRDLNSNHLIHTKIHKAKVFWDRSIAVPSVEDFCAQIVGQTIRQIERRGKFIVFTLSTDTLLIHLRMTGKIMLSNNPKVISSHERLQLQLDDGRVLHYEDQRKFGKWYLLSHPEDKLNALGLEPLSEAFTLEAFKQILKKSTQRIKSFLLDQHHITGLGNIYVDEALWEAKIHPMQQVKGLSLDQIKALHRAIPKVLEQGLALRGTSLGKTRANYSSLKGHGENQDQLKVFRRQGSSCPRCHEEIIKITVAQRGTHLCPHCQVLTQHLD